MTWTVNMFPEEEALINEILSRKLNNEDGRGDMIAPVRGGIIYLQDYKDMGYTEEQMKWLVYCKLQDARYKMTGVKGLRFMNFTYHGELPGILEDPESMDKFGVPRATTDGQPCNPVTGFPMDHVSHKVDELQTYKWDIEKKQYVKAEKVVTENKYFHGSYDVPEKVLD